LTFKGVAPDFGAYELGDVPLTVDDQTQGAAPPEQFDLQQNHPNPFYLSGANGRTATRIEFAIGENAVVCLEVLNILGQRVRTLLEGEVSAGRHAVVWDGRDYRGAVVATGVYVYRLAGITQTTTGRAAALTAHLNKASARLLFFSR
jgi:hypothetical protein